eukprot:8776658-Ditylum_brightwellii.AAC.1
MADGIMKYNDSSHGESMFLFSTGEVTPRLPPSNSSRWKHQPLHLVKTDEMEVVADVEGGVVSDRRDNPIYCEDDK